MRVILFSLLLSTSLFAKECPQSATTYSCVKYLRNHDGDTITFGPRWAGEKNFKLRVVGIDTAEMVRKGKGSPCQFEKAREAKAFVAQALKNAKDITITGVTGADKYGRTLGNVVYDGKDLKKELLSRGLAMVYVNRRQKNINWCNVKPERL